MTTIGIPTPIPIFASVGSQLLGVGVLVGVCVVELVDVGGEVLELVLELVVELLVVVLAAFCVMLK